MINLTVMKLCSTRFANKDVLARLLPSLSTRMNSTHTDDGGKGKIPTTKPSNGESPKSSTPPQYYLSYVDKLTLKYFGNFKGEIPSEVSFATIEKAESKRRIFTNLILVAFCAFGSMFAVYNVKRNLQETGQNIYVQNSKRYQKNSNEKN